MLETAERAAAAPLNLPADGLVAVVKRDCPTCVLVAPLIKELSDRGVPITVYSQDDPSFPDGLSGVRYDDDLGSSFGLNIEFVPTVIRMEAGREAERIFGWSRAQWQALTGIPDLGKTLPDMRPACGSKTTDPGMQARLKVRFSQTGLASRRIPVPREIDPLELVHERGWSDGLPLVPPTEERVMLMLEGTARDPKEVVGLMPPNRVECTVEKIAINAVMAGCKPEYLPVVITAVEAALIPEFGLHGVLATTNAVAPVIMVNGPIAKGIGMNSKGNVLGQGFRANATIGRALQLVVRNVGGGRPQEVDRAVFGNPGKYTFCFAEDEDDGIWPTYAEERGFKRGTSTVTLFPGDGNTPIIDHISREPEGLVQSYAGCLRSLYNPGQINDVSAFILVSPEHAQVFYDAGWSKQRVKDELYARLKLRRDEILEGRQGIGSMKPEDLTDPNRLFPKFRTGSLNLARAGGSAGKYSAIISGLGSITINPCIKEVRL